ncbi:MAG: PIN domain-containing protein [Actinomycetota bacterium]
MSACLDASAVIAWLHDDHGAEAVGAALAQGRPCMSWINAGEVHYVVSRQESHEAADRLLSQLRADVDLVDATPPRVLAAAAVKAAHKMSYADCFAVAAAIEQRVPLLTTDPEILSARLDGLRAVDIRSARRGRRRP